MGGMARGMLPETAVKISRNGHMDHLNGSLTLQFFPQVDSEFKTSGGTANHNPWIFFMVLG
jgi:hypothetical protein